MGYRCVHSLAMFLVTRAHTDGNHQNFEGYRGFACKKMILDLVQENNNGAIWIQHPKITLDRATFVSITPIGAFDTDQRGKRRRKIDENQLF